LNKRNGETEEVRNSARWRNKKQALRSFVWVQFHQTAKEKNRTRDAEMRRSEEGKMLAGVNELFLLSPQRLRVSCSIFFPL
jgi:hypothetical protein